MGELTKSYLSLTDFEAEANKGAHGLLRECGHGNRNTRTYRIQRTRKLTIPEIKFLKNVN